MPPIIRIQDRKDLVETSQYPYASWVFEKFNPVQSRVFEFYDKDVNSLIAVPTGTGKTLCAELIAAHELSKRKGTFLYLCPLRALAQERIDDWTDSSHHFSKKKISICTGDYRLTKERKKELEEAEIIIATYEMFSHRARNYKSEGNEFLKQVGTVAIDESHILTVPGRGDHLEVGLMKFTEINPKARLVLLSATMPNVDEIGEWISYILTKKETYVLQSDYRSCPLNIHYEKYDDSYRSYDLNERSKVDLAMEIVEHYNEDKFLVFAHTKRTGELMLQELRKAGIKSEFHNAGLDKEARKTLERDFRTDPKLRVVVATSTLAAGLNMPARRVIILGVHRGVEEVAVYDIMQEAGRAGRPAYDPVGDAYILLPETREKYETHRARLKRKQPIISQLLTEIGEKRKALAFHLISEIHHGDVKSRDDVHYWYGRSLARFQNKEELRDDVVEHVLDLLKKCRAVIEEPNGDLKATAIGKISSIFYFSPFDVYDLRKNFTDLFDENYDSDDIAVAMALGNTDTNRVSIVTKGEREEMSAFINKVRNIFPDRKYLETAIKAGFIYYSLLNGNNPVQFSALLRTFQSDSPRIIQVLHALDTMTAKWNKKNWLNDLQNRVAYGVKPELVNLVKIPKIGKVKAKKLYMAGLKTVEDVSEDAGIVSKVLGISLVKAEEICEECRRILLV